MAPPRCELQHDVMAAAARQTRRGTPLQLGGLFLPACDSGDRWMPSGGVLAMPFKFQLDWRYESVGFYTFWVGGGALSQHSEGLSATRMRLFLVCFLAKDDGSRGSYLFSLLCFTIDEKITILF